MRTSSALAIPLLLGACLGNPGAPVPVLGDAMTLEGHWVGEYSSLESGRAGSITFSLEAGRDTAVGDVLMIPRDPQPNYVSQYIPFEPGPMPEPLRIKLVRVFGQQVAGQLMPYKDPDCGCTVTTMFSGRLNGNVLDGVFYTYHPDRTVTGKWRVTRER